MKNYKLLAVIFLLVILAGSTFAGDKEDVQATMNNIGNAFNSHNFKAYFDAFTDDYTVFTAGGTPLRYDASAWKDFIESTASLEYVNYSQQDNVIQVYNGNAAVVTGYYVFKNKAKGGKLNTETGRASTFMVKKNGKWLIAHMHYSKMF